MFVPMPRTYRHHVGAQRAGLLGGLATLATAGSAFAQVSPQAENQRCMECHGQAHMATLSPADRLLLVVPIEGLDDGSDTRPGLFIDYNRVYGASVHSDVACVSCHVDCDTLPHAAVTAPARCDACHETEQADYATSVHGAGSEAAAHCADCHGDHDMLSHLNPQSRTHKLNLPFTCATCHSNPRLMEQEHVHQPHAAEQYIDSMHGRGLLDKGLVVAPSCNDCHGIHDILPAEDPDSTIHRDNIPATCGTCHIGIEEIYAQSVHGRLLAAGDERGPVCATCHTAHEIVAPDAIAFKLQSDDRCGQCHSDRLERYHETFHGKAAALGNPNVAACYDCHGHHDIVGLDDPRSRLAGEQRVETCKACHPAANGNFAGYIAHADHTDRANYPVLYWTFIFMTTIVVSTFMFFGVHTILWGLRSIVLFLRNPKSFRHKKTSAACDSEQYVRFRPFDRFLHAMVVSSFLLLVATGMPLKFYYTGWAQMMIDGMGGIEVASALHRVGAIITFLYFGLHLISLLKAGYRNRGQFKDPETGRYSLKRYLGFAFGPEMPLPSIRDLRDWWAHQKWFFGRGPQPDFDKWTYWEKFDYFAVFWGVFIIGLSGLVMWFPEASTTVLPGWIINVALIVHSDEALLAAGFIFTFHFFNVHFRPEKFPMDTVIFSGRISRTEMQHERKRWLERLEAEGRLEEVKVKDEWPHWKRVMHPLGFLAFGIGTLLLLLIFYAMSSRLFGGGH